MRRARASNKHAVYALARLYAELGGRLQREPSNPQLRLDLDHVAAAILLFAPGFDLASIAPVRRNKKNLPFRRGECVRSALGILREAGEPLTTRGIAMRMLATRGIAGLDRPQVKRLIGAIHVTLCGCDGRSVISDRSVKPLRWRLKE